MTWKELRKQIKLMSKDQKNSSVFIRSIKRDENYVVDDYVHCKGAEILDGYHPFLVIKE